MMSHSTKLIRNAIFAMAFAFASPMFGQELDFSSDQALKSSLELAQEGMTATEREEFGKAFLRVLLSRHPATRDLEGLPALMAMAELGDKFFTSAEGAFDGITVEIIKEELGSYKSERVAMAQEAASVETSAEEMLSCLKSKVILSNPRFEGKDGSWFKVDITNGLSWAIRGYHVTYTIRGDGRSVPVKEDDASSEISGGIEPGETRTVNVWAGANIEPYETTSIEVSLINLFDPKNRRIIDNNINYIGRSPDLSPFTCE